MMADSVENTQVTISQSTRTLALALTWDKSRRQFVDFTSICRIYIVCIDFRWRIVVFDNSIPPNYSLLWNINISVELSLVVALNYNASLEIIHVVLAFPVSLTQFPNIVIIELRFVIKAFYLSNNTKTITTLASIINSVTLILYYNHKIFL